MELKDLSPMVLMFVLIGILIGVGVILLGSLQTASYDITSVVNESHTLVGGDTTLNNGNILSVGSIENSTAKFVYPTHFNFSTNGTVDSSINGTGPYNITYSYNRNTTASGVSGAVVEAVAPIASTWMALMITIASLAIILGLVIKAFGGKGR